MTRHRTRDVSIPRGWTPEAAAAAIGLLERVADALWQEYGDAIWAWRDQQRLGPDAAEGREPGGPGASTEPGTGRSASDRRPTNQ